MSAPSPRSGRGWGGRPEVWAVLALAAALLVWFLWRPAAPAPGREVEPEREAPRPRATDPQQPGRLAELDPGGVQSPGLRVPPPGEAEATPGAGDLEIEVVAGGSPVPRAPVRLYLRGGADPNTGLTDWRVAGAGTTGSRGTLRLPAGPGLYLASARAPGPGSGSGTGSGTGLANGFVEVRRAAAEPLTRARIELEPGTTLSGRVVAAGTREAVALAHVALTPKPKPAGPLRSFGRATVPPDEVVTVECDERGVFRASGLGPGEWQVEARAEGMGRARAAAVRLPRREELILELLAAGFIEGRVLLADGSPAGGAILTATAGHDPASVAATAQGTFSLEVEPRAWRLSARRGVESASAGKPIPVAAGQTVQVELRLSRGASIAGVVTTASDGKPLGSARISVSPEGDDGDFGRAQSGPDGAFAVEGLPAGSYDVAVERDGFLGQLRRGLAVVAGQTFPLRIALSATGRVEGFVRDSHGTSVAGAVVRLLHGPSNPLGDEATTPETRTSDDGSYALLGVPAGRLTLAARRATSAAGVEQEAEVRGGEIARADFTLADEGTVTGSVRRSAGPLPEGVFVVAQRAQGPRGMGSASYAAVDTQGGYRLELSAGSYLLTAQRGSAAVPHGPARDVTAVEAGRSVVKDLLLADEPEEPATLAVQVREPGGAPSAEAFVLVQSGQPGVSFFDGGGADEQGRFFVRRPRTDLPETLSVWAQNGGRTGLAQASRNDAVATVQLDPAARLAGQITGPPIVAPGTDNSGATTFHATVSIARPQAGRSGQELSREFAGDRFTFDDLPPGTGTITVLTADGRTGTATTQLLADQVAQVQIVLGAATSLSGRVVDEKGQPIAQVFVLLDGRSSGEVSGADGRFSIDSVTPGEHKLGLNLPPFRQGGPRAVSAPQGQRTDVGDLLLPSARTDPGATGLVVRGDSDGVTVTSLLPGGPADTAGILVGDRIAAVDGAPVTNVADARGRLRGTPGSTVAVTVVRNGASQTLLVTRAR